MIIKEIKESHLQIIPDTFTFNLVLFGDVKEKIMNPDTMKSFSSKFPKNQQIFVYPF